MVRVLRAPLPHCRRVRHEAHAFGTRAGEEERPSADERGHEDRSGDAAGCRGKEEAGSGAGAKRAALPSGARGGWHAQPVASLRKRGVCVLWSILGPVGQDIAGNEEASPRRRLRCHQHSQPPPQRTWCTRVALQMLALVILMALQRAGDARLEKLPPQRPCKKHAVLQGTACLPVAPMNSCLPGSTSMSSQTEYPFC